MRILLSCLICFVLSGELSAQSSVASISGWKREDNNGQVRFTPSVLFNNIPLHYDIYPPLPGGNNDLAGWLQTLAQKDLSALRLTPLPGSPRQQDIKTMRLYSQGVKDPDGRQLLATYIAFTRPDGTIRYGRIITTPAVSANSYMTAAAQHFSALYQKEGGTPTQPTAPTDNKGSTTVFGKKLNSPGNTATPVTAPGQGLKPSDIRGVIIHQESAIGVGGMPIIKWRPFLLLKDGTCYKHCAVSPYDLDVARSRQMEPKQWGTYTIGGKTMTVTMNEDHKPEQWTSSRWQWTQPAEKNEKITGNYYTIGGGGNTAMGGGSIVVSSSDITFNDKGQFTRASTGGGTYTGSTGSVSAYSNKDAAGTYILDGYSLELRYNNGTTSRVSFYFYFGSKDVFGMADRDYVPSK